MSIIITDLVMKQKDKEAQTNIEDKHWIACVAGQVFCFLLCVVSR